MSALLLCFSFILGLVLRLLRPAKIFMPQHISMSLEAGSNLAQVWLGAIIVSKIIRTTFLRFLSVSHLSTLFENIVPYIISHYTLGS